MKNESFFNHSGLFLFFILIVVFKATLSFNSPSYNPNDDTCLYPTEAAMQYHYAKLVAQGESLPEIDFRAQYPEGLNFKTDLTLCMEYIAGFSYRFIFHPTIKIPFHVFSIWFIAFVSTLPLFVCFWGAKVFFQKNYSAWFAVLIYGLSPFFFLRGINNFGRENLSLFFIFLGSVGFLGALNQIDKAEWKKWTGLIFSALGWGLALLSWHVSRFVLEIEFTILLALFLLGKFNLKEKQVTVYWVLLLFPFIFLLPELKSRSYFLSPGVFLGYGLIIDFILEKFFPNWKGKKKFLLLPVLVALGVFLKPKGVDSHVFSLMVDKLRFFLIKPQNPDLLSFESRTMWIEAFHSPRIDQVFYYFPFLGLFTFVGIFFHWKRIIHLLSEKWDRLYLVFHTLVFGFLFLMIFRMHGFFIFWFSLLIGGMFSSFLSGKKFIKWTMLSFIMFQILFSAWQSSTIKTGNFFKVGLQRFFSVEEPEILHIRQSNLDLVNWVKDNTGKDEVFAGWFGTTPLIFAYADRPITLQPKFENQSVRKKFKEFTLSLFESEEAISKFCSDYKVDYLIYQTNFLLDTSRDSLKYISGKEKVTFDSPVYLFHFKPLDLENFELVYQNPSFRVFQYLSKPDQRYKNLPIGYEPIYDKKYFECKDETFSDEVSIYPALEKINQLYAGYSFAIMKLKEGNISFAEETFGRIVKDCPLFYRAWLRLGEINLTKKDFGTAEKCFEKALEGFPKNPEAENYLDQF